MFWTGIIYGEPCSKANSRRLVNFGKRPAIIKSQKGLDYVMAVVRQTPRLDPMLQGRLRFTAHIFYASERPDLDESIILDALQGRIYANDRMVRERHVVHGVDRVSPRSVVYVEEIE